MSKTLWLVCFALLLHAVRGSSHDFPMLHYTVEDGLPSNTVYGVYRDTKGFLWMATDKGVARFNGIKFDLFSTANGLPDNEVFFIQEDKEGRIWFGSFNGKLCFYKNNTFHNALNTPFLRLPKVMPHMQHISVEYDSSLIIGFADSRQFVTIKNDRCKIYDLDRLGDPSIGPAVIFRKKVSANMYKLICGDKLVYIDTFCRIVREASVDKRFVNESKSFAACQDEEYMFNSDYIYNTKMQMVRKFPAQQKNNHLLQQIYESRDKIFYAASDGVFINDTIHVLPDENASGITQDIDGNYWISTLTNGIFVLKEQFSGTTIFRNVYENKVKYARPYKGDVYFVTEANDVFDMNERRINCISFGNTHTAFGTFPVDFGFCVGGEDKIYDTYDNTDLVAYDVRSGTKKTIFSGDLLIKDIYVSGDCIYGKRAYDISMIAIDEGSGRGHDVKYAGGQGAFDRIFCMAEDSCGCIWYSTINKVYRIIKGSRTSLLQPQFGSRDLKYFTFCGGKLVGYTQNNQLLVCSDFYDKGMITDSIAPMKYVWDKICTLDSNHILVSTNSEYVLLTVSGKGESERIIPTVVENPFIPRHAEAFCTEGDNCIFFKNHSVTVIDNKSLLEAPSPPQVSFSYLKTGNELYPITEDLDVPFVKSKHISIDFDTRSFSSKNVLYQYSISKSGQDNWRDIGGEEITLLNPGYGDYVVKIRAKSLSSIYSAPAVFTLHILRPYWAMWWFDVLLYIAVIAAVGFAVWQIITYVLRKKQTEHEREIKFVRSEYKALNALMNPHFIFNTLNNVQGLVNRNDKLAANEYIRVFADLVRQNMHNVSKDLIPLQKEMELVTNYLMLEKLRFKDHLNYQVNIDENTDLSEIMVPPLLVQPLVENSIKHGILPLESKEGLIVIDIYEKEGALYIDVKDNGVGMGAKADASLKHESYGLDNIRKRIEHLGMMQNKKIEFVITEERGEYGKLQWMIARIIIPT